MNRIVSRAILALVCASLVAAPARAWVPHTATIAAVKTATPPKLDASLSDPAWKSATTFTTFYDFTDHRAAKLATTAYLLYDDKNLYFAVHCEQQGVPIVAAQTVDHAGVANDDHVALNLETSGSGSRVYQFRVNPHGIHDEYSSENARYAPSWQSVTKIFPNGDWNAMMIVPLKDIRSNAGVTSWQVDVARFVAATNDEYTWAYDDTMSNIAASPYWPHLVGLHLAAQDTRPKPHADIYALGAAGADRGVFQNGIGNFENTKARTIGIDATVPITNTLAFVGTLNPDFSNVEQDQTTIAPQEFQRQYNEYRPFFAQGAQYINALPGVNINSADIPFYSPRIGIFDRGFKLEGTQGRAQIGVLNAGGAGFSDSAFGYQVNTSDNSFTYGFTGVNADHTGLRDQMLGGAIATTNPHSGAFVLSKYQFERGTLVDANGQAGDFQVGAGVQNAHTLALLKYEDVGPEYAPVDAYITENDVRGPQFFYQYSGSGRRGIKSYQVLAGADRFVDRSGAAHQSDVFTNVMLMFKNQFMVTYGQSTSELRVYAAPYPFYTGATVVPFNSQSLSVGYRDGTPSPIDASYSWGPFANNDLQRIFLQQPSLSLTHQYGRYGISLALNGNVERALPGSLAPALDSQWYRSVSLTRSFGRNTSVALGLRGINGTGGYAMTGTNLAFSFHERFANLDELYVDYGTPAAASTLNRFIVKYVFHVGGETGT
ncbi:MAG: hypothetical protein KGN02_04160 [bacterium]|nr:hypothetical protein [bacterium]